MEVEIAEVAEALPVYAHWMSIILLVGPRTKMTFKAHFNTSAGQNLAAPAYNKNVGQISLVQVHDYMREYCNLTAGGIKGVLLSKLSVNLSLPVVCRGFDELFFTEKSSYVDQWKLVFNGMEIICTCAFVLEPDLDLTGVNENESATDETSEIEFL